MANNSLYCQLDTTCTAAILVRYTLQCLMGNYTVATRNVPSRQIKSKSRSKHLHFRRHGAYCLPCNSPKYLFCAMKWPAFRPDLFWLDTVANQVSICWRLRAPLESPTASNIQFFECCMSSYRSPALNDVLWPPKQLFRRHSATYTLVSFRYEKRTSLINISTSRLLRHMTILRPRLLALN